MGQISGPDGPAGSAEDQPAEDDRDRDLPADTQDQPRQRTPEEETCDTFDNDLDGIVDEGCSCAPGATQACYPDDPATLDVGVCQAGTQTCEAHFEFGEWGACDGAVGPSAEVCDDGLDNDCDGEADEDCGCQPGDTRACFPFDPLLVGVGLCSEGTQTCLGGDPDAWGDCEGAVGPAEEVCEDGLDNDCDGVDEECPPHVVVLDIDINGDCVYAHCPPEAPFPIGCDIVFDGNDGRGCVANAPGSSDVYFQEGNVCSAGHVSGTLTCSTELGDGLDADNCPIHRQTQFYVDTPCECPDCRRQ